MIPEEELAELKDSVDIVDVINEYTPLQKHGRYYVGLCLFHNDTEVGSFKVDERKQTYKCYSCGSGGDVIAFLENTGKGFKEVVEALKAGEKLSMEVKARKVKEVVPLAEFRYIKPSKAIPASNFKHSKFGNPTNTYTYKDADGSLVGYVLRYMDKEGKKQILPYNYATCIREGFEYEYKGKGAGKFYKIGDITTRFIGFGDKKPIYGLEKLAENPDATVIVLEGEKCVDWFQKRFNPKKIVAIGWQSGTNNVDQVDWSPLHGRRTFLFPDNDWGHKDTDGIIRPYIEQPSPKAFNYIRQQLAPHTNDLRWVKVPKVRRLPDGWDIADTSMSPKEVAQFIKEHSRKII